jgi:hypothetical protein
MKVNNAKNPIWANEEHTAINLYVDFDHLDEEYVPCTVSLNDAYDHIKDLFLKASNGDFGSIAEYVAPIIPEDVPIKITKEQLQMQISALQAQLDELK